MDSMLQKRLRPIMFRHLFRRIATALGVVWLIAALVAGAIYYRNLSSGYDPSQVIWLLIGGTFAASLVAVFHAVVSSKSIETVAHEIEEKFPDLDASLLTSMQLRSSDGERLGFLEQDVLRKSVTHSYDNRWASIIPGWHLLAAPLAGLIGLLGFAAAMSCLIFHAKPTPVDETIRFADAAIDESGFEITVEPGNTEIERGTSLLVLARFDKSFPPEATLVVTDVEGVSSRLPMLKSLDDPVFGARVSSVKGPLKYQVDFATAQSDQYEVTVFDFPKLVQADAALDFPDYTQMESKVVQDVRRVNAVEGTSAEFSFFVNKPVVGAQLVPVSRGDADGQSSQPIELTADPEDPKKLVANIKMEQSQKFEVVLRDADNRENRSPPKLVLNVLENRPPELKLLAPGKDVEASPIEEVQLSASAWDDFGLKSFGLRYGIVGEEEKQVLLQHQQTSKTTQGRVNKRKRVDHLLDLEKLSAEPDNLVSYHFFAEDIGPDGQPRTVASDMYFAEVRHFEEIFRQGETPTADQQQQQQQQQGQNAQQAQQLGELQKEIVTGTWNVIRREKKGAPSEKFGPDLEVLIEAQNNAIEKLAELAENVEDEKSLGYVETVRTFMSESVLRLTQAHQDADVDGLSPALSSQQAAYQGLLKLRAREHEVTRQQQPPGQQQQGQQQNNRAQNQLNELELKEDENRYENEKTAQEQTQQQAQAQEDRQVLNRLKELARRQSDLNDRVKELQSALEEAKTDQEREEIERRLKSLREQQEQLLRDTEELSERMQNQENQERMSEESEQLDKTRENIRRANEALKENEVSRAAAEGTRAQRDLEELRDEFQNRTAGQFTEKMRQMRQTAQELEEKEKQIGDALANEARPKQNKDAKDEPNRSLREQSEEKPSLQQELADQQDAVEKLREQMKQTIEESESFEPLLAEELYDTYRDSEVTRPDEALESARRSLSRGWVSDALTEEEKARQGITQIREGIEKAAQNVLGDETEALKAAEETLRGLNRELEQELKEQAKSDPTDESEQRGKGQSRDGDQSDPQEGERESDSDNQKQRGKGKGKSADSKQGQGKGKQGDQKSKSDEGKKRGEGKQGEGKQGEGKQGEGKQGEGKQGEGKQGEGKQGEGKQGEGKQGEGKSKSESKGKGRGEGKGQGGGQEGQGNGEGQESEQQTDAERLREQIRQLGTQRSSGGPEGGAPNQISGGGGNPRPISGDDFRDWSDRLRDVEEMIGDPDLRAEASRIREQAREIRKEMKRHSKEPNWDLVKMKVAKPLAELQDRVAEELIRRSGNDDLVPLDRDPVPAEYQDAVRRYYQRLGSGQ